MQRWLPLVVDEGQPALSSGTLLRVGQRCCLVADGGTVLVSKGAAVSAALATWLAPSSAVTDFSNLEGRRVVAAGQLQDRQFVVAKVQAGPHVPPPARQAAAYTVVEAGAVTGKSSRHWLARSSVETELMKQGALLDIWQEEPGRWIALAADADRVATRLSSHYGDALQIVTSRWESTLLDQLEATLGETEIVESIGRKIDEDHQMRVDAVLLHLPSHMAHRLDRFPADALDLQVLVSPLPG
ncbi:hypothetical protein [Micromonospora maritima]|uniref:Uncharacterized protein n=1 Tax=Micromonospora maritima TaxID=986711 RepID=A0ABW7ZRI5_9ACTN